MEFEFSGKIKEVYFTDAELSTVAILYGEDDEYIEYSLTVDNEDPRWLALLDEVTMEQIEESTVNFHNKHRDLFKIAFEDYAGRHDLGMTPSAPADLDAYNFTVKLLAFDTESPSDAQDLFKIKLAVFDHDLVKASKSKVTKTAIRRATTPMEVFKAFSKLVK
jgi:hypothetical protein